MNRPSPAHTIVDLANISVEDGPAINTEDGPAHFPVVWADEDHIIVSVHHNHVYEVTAFPGAKLLTPGDDDGIYLVRIHTQYIKAWFTDEESEYIMECSASDQQLLQGAR